MSKLTGKVYANKPRASAPRAVTRGEFSPNGISGVKTKIDWVHASWTFDGAEGDPVWVRDMIFCEDDWKFEEGKGIFGFANSYDVLAMVEGQYERVAMVAWGGKGKQANMGFVQITGTGCNALNLNSDRLKRGELWQVLMMVGAKLTRLDIAFDTEDLTILDCMDAYKMGQFSHQGTRPVYQQHGDWEIHEGRGRTLYVGKIENGKTTCCYEKGKQLGDPESEWLRIEARWGNRDRVIPLEAITDTDAYFAGASPFHASLVDAVPAMVRCYEKAGSIVAERLAKYASVAYGKLVHVLRKSFTDEAICDLLTVEGAPRRMVPFLTNGGFFPERFFHLEVVS